MSRRARASVEPAPAAPEPLVIVEQAPVTITWSPPVAPPSREPVALRSHARPWFRAGVDLNQLTAWREGVELCAHAFPKFPEGNRHARGLSCLFCLFEHPRMPSRIRVDP